MDPATHLRLARERAGLTQAALAEHSGTSQATISAYESGEKRPSVSTLDRLLAATGSRLAVDTGHAPIRRPSEAQLQRAARELSDVLALAAALPTHHRADLGYPPLRAKRP